MANSELRLKLVHCITAVRGNLEEQCFWAYPPPYVAMDARPKDERAGEAFWSADGFDVLRTIREGKVTCRTQFPNASLELYRRYKYGPEERKYFRNCARRAAAQHMVKWYLLLKNSTKYDIELLQESL